MNRNTLLGLVHKGAKKLFKDDEETRRAWQKQRTGHSSCRDMTIEQLEALVNELRRKKALRKYSPKSQGSPADVARAMWITMHKIGLVIDPSEDALDRFTRRMVRVDERGRRLPENIRFGGVAMLAHASHHQVDALLNALRGWVRREYRERLNSDLSSIISRQARTAETSRDAALALLNAGRIRYWDAFYDWFGLYPDERWKTSDQTMRDHDNERH